MKAPPTFTRPVDIPRGFGLANPASPRPYDIMPDGRIVGVRSSGASESGPQQIQVVLNWFEELKARAPTATQ